MGLEVWVYAGLTKADDAEVDSDGYPRDWSRYWRAAVVDSTEYSYPGRTAGLEQDAIYAYTACSEFQAGSTKTFRQWRDALARLAGYESAKAVQCTPPPGSFVELINFFDCAGVIGPVAAAKLARDFTAFRKQAEAVGGAFFVLYCLWQEAFENTAGCGALRFTTTMNDDQSCRVCGITDAEMYQQPIEPIDAWRYWIDDDLCSVCWKRAFDSAGVQPSGEGGIAQK